MLVALASDETNPNNIDSDTPKWSPSSWGSGGDGMRVSAALS